MSQLCHRSGAKVQITLEWCLTMFLKNFKLTFWLSVLIAYTSCLSAYASANLEQLVYERKYQQVINECRKILKSHPNDLYVLGHCSWAEIYNGEYEQCIKHCTTAARIDPLNSQWHAYRAEAWSGLSNYQATVDEASIAIRLAPIASSRFYLLRGTALSRLNKYREAISDFDAGLKLAASTEKVNCMVLEVQLIGEWIIMNRL